MAPGGRWTHKVQRNLVAQFSDDKQKQSDPDEKQQNLRCAGTEFGDRDVFVTSMVRIAAMPVSIDAGAIDMCAVSVNMRALRSTNIAIGIDVRMQAAQLQGEQAQTSDEYDCRGQSAHRISLSHVVVTPFLIAANMACNVR